LIKEITSLSEEFRTFENYPSKIGWFIVTYRDQASTQFQYDNNLDTFYIIKVDEEGKLISRDQIILPYGSSKEEVAVSFQQQSYRQDSCELQRQHVHVCRKNCGVNCINNHLANKFLLITEYNSGTMTYTYELFNSLPFSGGDEKGEKGEKGETWKTKGEVLYSNFKIFIHHERNGQKSFRKIYFQKDKGEKVERKVITDFELPSGPVFQYFSHDDYLMIRFRCKVVVINFFNQTLRVYEDECLLNYQSGVINTSIYDFHQSRLVSEIIAPIFPRDLVKLLQKF
jgi:hypothetical protein